MNARPPTQLPDAVRREVFESLRGTGKRMPLSTTGDSMAPLIRNGMRVDIEFVPPQAVARGDIVLFERQGSFILHRVIGKDSATGDWIEKGDHQPYGGQVAPDRVWGRVVPSGSAVTRCLITTASRLEFSAYRLKTHLIGDRPTGAGRLLIALESALRRLISRTP